MTDDPQLLRSYALERSEIAFAELVKRHLNFVYATALRKANGDTHLAEDATQQVFADLARKAGALSQRAVLTGWLFTSSRFAVSRLIRGEQRRKAREQAAQLMDLTQDEATDTVDWDRLRPVLDDALAELSETDREAVLLRFFEGLGFARIGTKLDLTENAARMRVERALDKLAALLAKRGLTSSAVALTTVLAGQSVMAAPSGLAATVTGAALAGSSAGGVISLVTTFMSMNKLAMILAGAIGVTGASGLVVQSRIASELRGELQQVKRENQAIAPLQAENLRLARVAAEVNTMKADDPVLAQLQQDANALQVRMRVAEQQGAQARARRLTSDRGAANRGPQVLNQVAPVYPKELMATGTEGEVLVDFVVDRNGKVQDAFAAKSTLREFEGAALAAVTQWTFEPGEHEGRSVNTHLQVRVGFSRKKEGDPAVPVSQPN
ncbi:MAG: TonB family protein [Opitutaceae bacterium]